MSKLTAALLLILACTALASGHRLLHEDEDPLAHTTDSKCGEPMPGGFFPVEMPNAQLVVATELAAEEFVMNAMSSNSTAEEAFPCPDDYVVVPKSACQQVVAGTNYRIEFALGCDGSDYLTETIHATVFFPLPTAQDSLPLVTDLYVEEDPEHEH